MPAFGAESRANYAELERDLQRICDIAIKGWDCKIIDGGRTMAEQIKNVAKGVSQTLASKHLLNKDGKSEAMDIMPFPFDWDKIERGLRAIKQAEHGMEIAEVYMFVGYIQGIAAALGIPLRSGADWDSDRQFEDHKFVDLPHHELVK